MRRPPRATAICRPPIIIRADYRALHALAGDFAVARTRALHTHQRLTERTARLRGGGWEGDAADAWLRDVQLMLLPAVERLAHAYAVAATTLTDIVMLLQDAEARAAACLTDIQDAAPEDGLPTVPPLDKLFPDGKQTDARLIEGERDSPTDIRARIRDEATRVGGTWDDAMEAIPELADIENMTDSELQAVLLLVELRNLYMSLILMFYEVMLLRYVPSIAQGAFPDNDYRVMLRMSPDELGAYIRGESHGGIFVIYQTDLIWYFVGYIISIGDHGRSHYLQVLIPLFWALTPEERVYFLYYLAQGMVSVDYHTPGMAVEFEADAFRIPGFDALPAPVQALLLQFFAIAYTHMLWAVTDPEVRAHILGNWGPMYMGEDILEGDGNGDGWMAVPLVGPISGAAGARLRSLPDTPDPVSGYSTQTRGEHLYRRLAGRGEHGERRADEFVASLDDAQLRRTAENYDPELNNRVHERRDEIAEMTPAERERAGITEKWSGGRTDIAPEGMEDAGIYLGTSNNTSSGEIIAYEMTASGKSDPTLGVHVNNGNRFVEFDWATRTGDEIVLIDAKALNVEGSESGLYRTLEQDPSLSFDETGEWEGNWAAGTYMKVAREQSAAATAAQEAYRAANPDSTVTVVVEWRLPANTPPNVIANLMAELANQSPSITNIRIVRAS